MQADLQVQAGVTIPGREIAFTASRSGGPGGQNVNKVSTRVTLRWSPGTSAAIDPARLELLLARLRGRMTDAGEIVIHCDEERSQPRNLEIARERLASIVRGALRAQARRRPTRPTRASRERRLAAKRRRGEIKRSRTGPSAGD